MDGVEDSGLTDEQLIQRLRPDWLPRNHQRNLHVWAANRIEELLGQVRVLEEEIGWLSQSRWD